MMTDWNLLSEPLQLHLAKQAMHHAVEQVAGQAETLAGEMDVGGLADRGGADALRLLAAVVRATGRSPGLSAGHA